jgi:hypothetical protein
MSGSWADWMCTLGVRSANWLLLLLALHDMFTSLTLYSKQTNLFVYVERTWRSEMYLISGAGEKGHSGKSVSATHSPQTEQIWPWHWWNSVKSDSSIFEASNGSTGLANILYFRLNFISVLCIRLNAILSVAFYQLIDVKKFDLGLLQASGTKSKHWKVIDTEIGTHISYRSYYFLLKTYHGDKGQYACYHGQRHSRESRTVSSISSNTPICCPQLCNDVFWSKSAKGFTLQKFRTVPPRKTCFFLWTFCIAQ